MSTASLPTAHAPLGTAGATAATPTAVLVEGLRKTYSLRPVLREVSFSLPTGHCLALFGANGAGKTTLLRVLATLARPTAGRVVVAGLDVREEAAAVRAAVGFVGHAPLLYEDLTARENLRFFARMYGLPDAVARTEWALRRVGMLARGDERVRALSRGQTQRVALARGLLHAPAVLLLDEPDTGLDVAALDLLAELVAERRAAGQTTLLTTHALERGLALSDTTLVLAQGRVAHLGPSAASSVAEVRAWCAPPARGAVHR